MSDPAPIRHIPVLLDEVIDALAACPGERHVDATFGAGGYTRALLSLGARVFAFDRDPDAIAAGEALEQASGGKLTLVPAPFSAMESELAARDALPVEGVTMDIGVSSMHLDQAERGFSFQSDGPLDMRMSQEGESAADFVNHADEEVIADVLYEYGEEHRSRRVARAIVAARPITRTGELAHIVRKALGHKPHDKKDPATRVFQAIRIHVNRELGELADGLAAAERVLAPGGRLAVGRPAGQTLPARAQRRDTGRFTAPARSRGRGRAEFRAGRQGSACRRCRGGAQPACPLGDVAGGPAHVCAGLGF